MSSHGIAPGCKRALSSCETLLLTSGMLAVRQCPGCGSNNLLRGELVDSPSSE